MHSFDPITVRPLSFDRFSHNDMSYWRNEQRDRYFRLLSQMDTSNSMSNSDQPNISTTIAKQNNVLMNLVSENIEDDSTDSDSDIDILCVEEAEEVVPTLALSKEVIISDDLQPQLPLDSPAMKSSSRMLIEQERLRLMNIMNIKEPPILNRLFTEASTFRILKNTDQVNDYFDTMAVGGPPSDNYFSEPMIEDQEKKEETTVFVRDKKRKLDDSKEAKSSTLPSKVDKPQAQSTKSNDRRIESTSSLTVLTSNKSNNNNMKRSSSQSETIIMKKITTNEELSSSRAARNSSSSSTTISTTATSSNKPSSSFVSKYNDRSSAMNQSSTSFPTSSSSSSSSNQRTENHIALPSKSASSNNASSLDSTTMTYRVSRSYLYPPQRQITRISFPEVWEHNKAMNIYPQVIHFNHQTQITQVPIIPDEEKLKNLTYDQLILDSNIIEKFFDQYPTLFDR
jgi:hypothetical protein